MRFLIAGFIIAGIFACTPKQDTEALASKTKIGVEDSMIRQIASDTDAIKVKKDTNAIMEAKK